MYRHIFTPLISSSITIHFTSNNIYNFIQFLWLEQKSEIYCYIYFVWSNQKDNYRAGLSILHVYTLSSIQLFCDMTYFSSFHFTSPKKKYNNIIIKAEVLSSIYRIYKLLKINHKKMYNSLKLVRFLVI